MKALDTNLLVRFLVRDDPEQAEKVRSLFQKAQEEHETFLIPTPVLLELIWVMRACYSQPRDAILSAIEDLSLVSIFEFENKRWLAEFIRLGKQTSLDLADLFLALSGKEAGGETTLTLDRRAATSDLFETL